VLHFLWDSRIKWIKMKPSKNLIVLWMAFAAACPEILAQTAEPKIEDIALVPRLTIRSELGVTNVIEYAEALATNQWHVLTNLVVTNTPYVVVDLAGQSTQRFYRVVIPGDTNPPTGMALIPAGEFTMGSTFREDLTDDLPLHTVYVSAFYMDKYEVTKALWGSVYVWALVHGYGFDHAGSGKASNHPVQTVNWYDVVKWCNARSEKEGRIPAYYTSASLTTVYRTGLVDVQNAWVKWNAGYRLPTEAEWEKAARGGLSGKRFPWGNTISHSQANYCSNGSSYDVSPTGGYHPNYNDGVYPYTSPVGAFSPNGYGLYDMAGNVWEWCWDWRGSYSNGSQTDPRGPTSGSYRVNRGGSWNLDARYCRVAYHYGIWPDYEYDFVGVRSALPSGQL
jgi:formylglycine-generating enzyme required for sulfatase activity